MLAAIYPKLPMTTPSVTKDYYVRQLSFSEVADYGDYLIVNKDSVEIHFFIYKDLKKEENYGQIYIRTTDVETWYQHLIQKNVTIHPNAPLEDKMWGMREFSLLDPDHNLLTFGQPLV